MNDQLRTRDCNLQPLAFSLQSYFLCGPTGVGKSALAILLAQSLNAEIVGADAFQIYEELPLLTAQPSEQEQQRIFHHLVGTIPSAESFDAARYRTLALSAIEGIHSRGKASLVVGGTGLYFRALLTPFDPLPTPDEALRTALRALSLEELLAQLHQLDPEAASLIDTKNRRRVERAVEIVTMTKRPLSASWRQHQKAISSTTPPPKGLLLTRDRPDLLERIEKNVKQMFEQGVVDEVAAVSKKPLSITASKTIGLQEIQQFLLGKQSVEEAKEKVIRATKRYAKRQLTWFRHQHSFPELNLSRFSSIEAAVEEALALLKS